MWCVRTGFDVNRSPQGAHLRVTGKALVEDPERTKDPVDFVQRLLAEKDKYDRCVMAKGVVFTGVACFVASPQTGSRGLSSLRQPCVKLLAWQLLQQARLFLLSLQMRVFHAAALQTSMCCVSLTNH